MYQYRAWLFAKLGIAVIVLAAGYAGITDSFKVRQDVSCNVAHRVDTGELLSQPTIADMRDDSVPQPGDLDGNVGEQAIIDEEYLEPSGGVKHGWVSRFVRFVEAERDRQTHLNNLNAELLHQADRQEGQMEKLEFPSHGWAAMRVPDPLKVPKIPATKR